MMTFCPACSLNVTLREGSAAGRQIWRCASCGLVLGGGAPAQPEQPGPPAGAAPPPRARPAPSGPPVDLRRPAPDPGASPQQLPWEGPQAHGDEAAGERPGAIPLDAEDPDEEFVVEAQGGERRITLHPPASGTPAFAARPQAGPGAAASVGYTFERVITAAVSPLGEHARDALLRHRVSREVTCCANGEQLLETIAGRLAAGAPADLIILDPELPGLTGLHAAVALRAVERGLRAAPTPLLFVGSRGCEEACSQVLARCQPARFMLKEAQAAPPQMALKLAQVLAGTRQP